MRDPVQKKATRRRLGTAGTSLALVLLLAGSAHAATLTIVNMDGPNEGFNDPTPVAPIGGNPGVTLGEQRLVAFQYAADIWGGLLDSDVEIFVQASFDSMPGCAAGGGVLGGAIELQRFANFPGAELPNTWYPVALANKLAGGDLAPGPHGTNADDILASFNSDVDDQVCFGSIDWYYGLDNNHGTDFDLVPVLLHELAHGLGSANFVSETTGTVPSGMGDVFSEYTFDVTTGKSWNQMTDAERAASALNTDKVVWSGVNVGAAVPETLAFGRPTLRVKSPQGLGPYRLGLAVFGAPLTSPGLSAQLVLALDPADSAGALTTDACSPLTNAAAVAGKIALVDRGTCGFIVKVKTAQNAGAIGVVVVDNMLNTPPPTLGGVDPTITIPSARVTLPAGNELKAALARGNVKVVLGLDPKERAGTEDVTDKILLYATNPVQPGTTISHWDSVATPNLLMEPAFGADLTDDVDLTFEQMVDLGWFSDGDGVADGRDFCIGSSPAPKVSIESCNTSAPNVIDGEGCKFTDKVEACATHFQHKPLLFIACVTAEAAKQKKTGAFNLHQVAEVVFCATVSQLP